MQRLTTSQRRQLPNSWSWDGKTVAMVELHPENGWDIAMLETASRRTTTFLSSKFNETYPEFSPDGRWIAYSSDESNKSREVYVRSFPDPGMNYQVSSEGGTEPLWGRDGEQLFYRWQDTAWVVDIQTSGGFSTSKPRLLFGKPGFAPGYPVRNWDLSADGQRFLMVKLDEGKPTPVTELALALNWFEELKRLCPTGRN